MPRCGNDIWSVQVLPPLPAIDVEVSYVTSTSAKVTWKEPYAGQAGGYTVLLQETGSQNEPIENPVTSGTVEKIISNLKPGTKYTVEVTARNQAGESLWWDTHVCRSFETPGWFCAE
jgi:hypothetical protein